MQWIHTYELQQKPGPLRTVPEAFTKQRALGLASASERGCGLRSAAWLRQNTDTLGPLSLEDTQTQKSNQPILANPKLQHGNSLEVQDAKFNGRESVNLRPGQLKVKFQSTASKESTEAP